jgi:hypothetical protein
MMSLIGVEPYDEHEVETDIRTPARKNCQGAVPLKTGQRGFMPVASASEVSSPDWTVVDPTDDLGTGAGTSPFEWGGQQRQATSFITAQRSALRSKPMPGASGRATRPSTTGQSSANPPNGAKTCG